MQYELFYLVGASKEADLPKIKAEIAEFVTSSGAVFEEKQVVEKRKMAYEIQRENRGFYVAQRFNLEDAEKIQSITRKLNLYAGILRSLIVRTDELPELTSREERETKSKAEPKFEAKKPLTGQAIRPESEDKPKEIVPTKVKKEEKAETIDKTPEEKKLDEADIDKKLEEILNI
ncbi:MAG: 30S ribosomal protein S6 [Parcubacteria group bacterium]|jgi:ribosomal protein S6